MTHEQAIKWLSHDEIHHTDMLEALLHRAADIVASTANALLLSMGDGGERTLLLSSKSKNDTLRFLSQIDDFLLLAIHQEEQLPALLNTLPLVVDIICYQSVYQSTTPLPTADPAIVIRPLGMQHFQFIKKYYTADLPDEYLTDRLQTGMVFGAYTEHNLAGFIGVHAEGSIGMLEVLPACRRQGVAHALQTFMTNHFLQNELVPFAQVTPENAASIALQKKLGYTVGQEKIIWLSRCPPT